MSRPWGSKAPFFDLKHKSPSSLSFLHMLLWRPHPAHVSTVLVPSLPAPRASPWPQGLSSLTLFTAGFGTLKVAPERD